MNPIPTLDSPSGESLVAEILSLYFRMKTSWHLAESYRESLRDARLPRSARLALGDRIDWMFYSLHNRMDVSLDYLCRQFTKHRAPGVYRFGRYEVQVLADSDASIFVDAERLLMFASTMVVHRAETR